MGEEREKEEQEGKEENEEGADEAGKEKRAERLKSTVAQPIPLPHSCLQKDEEKQKSRSRPLMGTLHNQKKRNFPAWREACSCGPICAHLTCPTGEPTLLKTQPRGAPGSGRHQTGDTGSGKVRGEWHRTSKREGTRATQRFLLECSHVVREMTGRSGRLVQEDRLQHILVHISSWKPEKLLQHCW